MKNYTPNREKRRCPCYQCRERAVGCHGKCEAYKEWHNALVALQTRLRDEAKGEIAAHDYTVKEMIKNKRK